MKITFSEIKKEFKGELSSFLFIGLSIALYSVAFTLFLLPYKITSGGVGGISSLIYFATGFKVYYSNIIINGILLIIALRIIGWKFCFKTIYGVGVMTLCLWLSQMIFQDADGNLPHILGENESFMAVVLGALFEGVALGFVFLNNGSTGGTDIVAACVNKYKDISLGHILIILDCIIVTSGYFIFKEDPELGTMGAIRQVLFGFVCLCISGITLDKVMDARNHSVQFLIFSRNYKGIADKLNREGFGVTVLDGFGWYTKTERKVVVIIAKNTNSQRIFRYIKEIDPYAFISMGKCMGVFGEGFANIKAKVKMKPTLVFATNNKHKLAEVKTIIGDNFEIRSLAEIGCNVQIPETAESFQGNALQKAEFVKKYYGFDCFADDTGLEVEALDGAPGVRSARYAGDEHNTPANRALLLKNMEGKENRKARFVTSIALIYNGETHFFDGEVRGSITTEERGEGGFGYDSMFIPDGYDKTFAELGEEVKNKISHRAEAVGKLSMFLNV